MQRQEKMAGTGMALTVATAVGGRLVGGSSWVDHAMSAVKIVGNDNLRKLIIPAVAVAGKSFVFQINLKQSHIPSTDNFTL